MDAYLLESGGQVPPYHVVSQVWGDIQEHLCLAGILWEVPISNSHKWDAILSFCRTKGVRWLWMDVLCINQTPESKDAQAEKAREIPNMSHYYRNAVACLVVPTDHDTFSHSYSGDDPAIPP
ncbi:hypothetical protein CONPUDRAFT_156306 [Coniophora puteana RWD-64-598 SS2]|uniref:Heterokaryon incompatibility domain-containing protein n=1 Tax=Coniophora puteana (strain RWD-64-598) TaxID=741705 RepID=A0A5M3MH88_CONPW|nr:uncharacterized protein CONPUDRAFT_156306 [Coniophora puteana RWD-64-598 SS2]EIW78310.1 hypothetical protein CONPUDRAFT_156306 [Coniophora puteana RWD-64-598 SS2]